MLLSIRRVNQDIINKYNDELVQEWLEHSIHEVHEGCWGIGDAEPQPINETKTPTYALNQAKS